MRPFPRFSTQRLRRRLIDPPPPTAKALPTQRPHRFGFGRGPEQRAIGAGDPNPGAQQPVAAQHRRMGMAVAIAPAGGHKDDGRIDRFNEPSGRGGAAAVVRRNEQARRAQALVNQQPFGAAADVAGEQRPLLPAVT